MFTSVLIFLGVIVAVVLWFFLAAILEAIGGYIFGGLVILIGIGIIIFGLKLFTAGGVEGAFGLFIVVIGLLVIWFGASAIKDEIHPPND